MTHFLKRILLWKIFLLLASFPKVWSQSFSVSPSVVKTFTENRIQVSVDGWDCNQIQVRTDNGKIKKISDCSYMLIPQRVGLVTIDVSKVKNGVVTELGSRKLTAQGTDYTRGNKDIKVQSTPIQEHSNFVKKSADPVFQVIFANRDSGTLQARKLLKEGKLDLLSDNTSALKSAKIIAFRITLMKADRLEFDRWFTTDELDNETLRILSKVTEDRKLIISSIKVQYEGNIIAVQNLEFKLRF